MRRFILPAAAWLAALAWVPPGHALEAPRFVLAADAAQNLRLDISGTWPDSCPPQLVQQSSQGAELHLLTVRETQGCHPTPTRYDLSTAALPAAEPVDDAGIRRVHLLLEEDGADPSLIGFHLLKLPGSPAAAALESGFWWAEQEGEFGAGPGLGLAVETQDELVSLSVMGYRPDGRATWHFGAGQLLDGLAHIELAEFVGGRGPFDAHATPHDIRLSGNVDVEVTSPARAILWFSRTDVQSGRIDLRPLPIVRFSFAQEPGEALLGRWLVAGTRAGSRETRWIELTEVQGLRDGFLLQDAEGTVSMQCDTPPARPASPPLICRLATLDGDLIEFTRVGLRRLAGLDADGQASVALRLD